MQIFVYGASMYYGPSAPGWPHGYQNNHLIVIALDRGAADRLLTENFKEVGFGGVICDWVRKNPGIQHGKYKGYDITVTEHKGTDSTIFKI